MITAVMTNAQLGFRGVRNSKFRHVFGSPAKRENCYENVTITKNAHDSNFCAVNPKFVAIVTEVAGGGAFLVQPITKVGRIDFFSAKVTGHAGPVLDIKWNPFNDNIIASCSEDNTVKLWYIPDGGLTKNLSEWLIDLHGHKRRVGFIEWHPAAANVLLSSGFDQLLIIWDVGKGEALNVIDCHPDVIYSMSFNKDGSRLATTCKDKKLRIIDPRTGFVINEGECHSGIRTSKVTYLGDTGRVVTTGFSRHLDRQVSIWNDDNLKAPLREEYIDSSSGIIFPYFDPDINMLYLAGKGDGNIRYYEIVDKSPYIFFLSQFISGHPQRGFGIMPKRGLQIAKCEIFRFYKLHATRGVCEPISMIVPRKSDQIQYDLYPDTAAPVAALAASDWKNGITRPPLTMSMKTGVTIRTHKPTAFKGNEQSKSFNTSDINYRMKHAFLSSQTVPDYRPLSSQLLQENEKNQKTSDNQTTKFQQIQQMFGNYTNQADGKKDELVINKINEDAGEMPKNEYQLQRSYIRQCEEIKMLRKQVASRDKHIKVLEGLIAQYESHKLK